MSTHFSPRFHELWLLLLCLSVLAVALISLELSQGNAITSTIALLVAGYGLIFAVAHCALCFLAPQSDQIMLPVVALLNSIGLVMIYRLDIAKDSSLAKSQMMWTVLSVLAMLIVLFFLKDHRSLEHYSYILGLVGLIFSALPIVLPSGTESDARVWISVGPVSIQPGEFSKIMLLLFFAALLVNKRTLFTVAGTRLLGLQFPRLRDLGPLLVVWAIAMIIMALQNDFGPALLLFGTVLGMLYMATARSSWIIIGVLLAVVGSVGVYHTSAKIQDRVSNFMDPLANYDSNGFQLSQALFGMSFGGVTGTGLGEGYPHFVPVAHSDFILAALGEELGFIGLAAILVLYIIFISRGMKTALCVEDSYGKLVAAGLALTFAVQIFVVAGGISKLLPMTGLTTPFIAHGGSSLLANYILLAILLRISQASHEYPESSLGQTHMGHAHEHGVQGGVRS